MTDELWDWSKLPKPIHGDDVFYGMLIPDEIAKLKRLHEAIGKWRDLADKELEEFRDEMEKQRTEEWDRYDYDPVRDEAALLLDTERVMFANLGVSIASAVENFILGICEYRRLNYQNKKGESDFGIACQSLGNSLNATISDLPGYSGNQRARFLGNCFKHSGGKKNDKFVAKFGGVLGEEIEYESENWPGMIGDTHTLLTEIIQRLK